MKCLYCRANVPETMFVDGKRKKINQLLVCPKCKARRSKGKNGVVFP